MSENYEQVDCATGKFHETKGIIKLCDVEYDYTCVYETKSSRPNQFHPVSFDVRKDGKKVDLTKDIIVEIISDIICSSDKGGEDL